MPKKNVGFSMKKGGMTKKSRDKNVSFVDEEGNKHRHKAAGKNSSFPTNFGFLLFRILDSIRNQRSDLKCEFTILRRSVSQRILISDSTDSNSGSLVRTAASRRWAVATQKASE
jgi:hypothetical protein